MLIGADYPLLIRDGEGVEAVAAFVKALQQRSWFADWIALQVKTIADGNPPPTPLMVMQSLTDNLEQFNLELITARRMYEQHPELLARENVSHLLMMGWMIAPSARMMLLAPACVQKTTFSDDR